MMSRAVPPSPHRDFCLWPYAPAEPPGPHSADGAELLLLLTGAVGAAEPWRGIIAGLRRALGPHATVWGLKWDGGQLSVELYFYDYARVERRTGLPEAMAALERVLADGVTLDPTVPYFMVSLELPLRPQGLAPIETADIYIGNPGSAVSSGLCYRLDAEGMELKNLYFFFDRQTGWDDFLGKLACSAQVPLRRIDLAHMAPGWLTACRTVVAANKRRADAVYFSGIPAAALLRFLGEFGWPVPLAQAFAAERARYDHLLFDVGFDYALDAAGAVRRGKSSLYAVC